MMLALGSCQVPLQVGGGGASLRRTLQCRSRRKLVARASACMCRSAAPLLAGCCCRSAELASVLPPAPGNMQVRAGQPLFREGLSNLSVLAVALSV